MLSFEQYEHLARTLLLYRLSAGCCFTGRLSWFCRAHWGLHSIEIKRRYPLLIEIYCTILKFWCQGWRIYISSEHTQITNLMDTSIFVIMPFLFSTVNNIYIYIKSVKGVMTTALLWWLVLPNMKSLKLCWRCWCQHKRPTQLLSRLISNHVLLKLHVGYSEYHFSAKRLNPSTAGIFFSLCWFAVKFYCQHAL